MNFVSPVLRLIDHVSAPETVSAHCDIPCGIYDPHVAQIAALTVLRMNQLIDGRRRPSADKAAAQLVRPLHQGEGRARRDRQARNATSSGTTTSSRSTSRSTRTCTTTFWNADEARFAMQAELRRRPPRRPAGATNRIAEIFWDSKGVATRKAGINQAVGGELVYVNNS